MIVNVNVVYTLKQKVLRVVKVVSVVMFFVNLRKDCLNVSLLVQRTNRTPDTELGILIIWTAFYVTI